MKATLSYKSKRNIIIASVIVVLLAAISTAGYFYIKGNDETARAFTQNEITNELTPGEQTQNNGDQQENQPQNPEQPATPGEQNNNGGEQTNNGQNQNNNQNRPNNNTTNNGSTPNQTTGNVPNQEYVTERTEERTTITKEYSVEWTPESITANASVQNLNIIRPIISANKSADKNAVVPGETITYTITVTNTGNADGKAIVKDTIPEATEFIENSIKLNGEDTNYTAQNLEEGITVDVAKQNEQGEAGTVKVEFKVKVSNIFAQYEKASIINQATVNEEKTNEVKNPVIKFEKSANKEKVEVGDTVTYTISIENIGDAEGTVIVKDTIPTGTKLVENSTIKLNGEDTNYTEQILNDGIELKVKSGERLEITFEVEVLSEITEAVKNTAYVNDIPTETIPTQVESLIKFESNGGTSVESMNGYTGDVIENREMPTTTREGYTFEGWYAEPELTNKVETLPEKYPAGTTTYYAKWTKNSYKITYKIVGDYFANNNYKEETLEYGAQITPEVNPTQEGYTFSGWSEIPETMPANDVVVEGSYTKNSYKITYKIVGDYFTNNNYKEETLEYGVQITPEANPTQEGYTFSGWSEIPEIMPAHDVEVVGSYTKNSYKITYKIVGDYFANNNYKEETLEYGAQITPEANPTQEGYTFSGWLEIPETMPAHDVEVVGSYTKNSYKIIYKIVGDYFTNNNYKEETLEYGAQITPEVNPTQEGYTFSGWSEILETMPAHDVEVVGSYTKNSYKITYKIVGDYFANNNYKEETLEYGAQITPEVNPTQEGYTFSGWSEIPETMPAHDVEVVGSYTKNSYKITYKIVGDYFTNNNYKEETLEYGAQIIPEANPTQEGYTFSGWSEIPETMPANDVVVEGSYTRNNYQYKVKYWYENEQGTYEPLETVIGGEVPYGTVIDTFTQKDGDGKYVLDHVDPAKSATDNKTANLVITHKESENILNVYYKRNSFNYKIEYYKEIANGEEFITSTGNKQQKLKTKITDDILKDDFGANWKNANKPQKGYQDGIVENAESTNYYITIKESDNVIKVVYKLKTNIEYKVKYYFNEIEDTSKEDSGTAKYGQQINSVKDYSDGGWEKSSKSTSLPYTIKESGNVIKVYYVKPDIKAKKTIWQDSTKLKDDAIVEAGSTVTYKITASNTGYLAGNVTIKDEELPQGNVTNITATGYTETLTVQDLKDGIVLNVPARGTAEVTITIKLTGAIGTPISNTAKYDNTETNKVENNVEKTVALKAKAEQVQVLNTNVILVMDISYSMNDRPVCTDHTTEKEHRDAGCSRRGDKWLKKDKKIDIAKTVINKFIDSVKLPDQATTDSSIIEVIKFNGWPDVVGKASNSQSKNDLKAKVNKLVETGGTWYSRPLAMTTEEITKLTEERPDNRNIVIFVSDGEPAKQDKKIIDEADKLKAVPNTTVYTVGFDADIEILKQIATDYGKYRTTDQASSLNTIFNEIVDEIAIKTEKKQSVSGKIELSNVDLNKTNKVVIKVNGTAISADKVQAAIVTENSKYYIDLNKLNLSSLRDDVLIEYFINE